MSKERETLRARSLLCLCILPIHDRLQITYVSYILTVQSANVAVRSVSCSAVTETKKSCQTVMSVSQSFCSELDCARFRFLREFYIILNKNHQVLQKHD